MASSDPVRAVRDPQQESKVLLEQAEAFLNRGQLNESEAAFKRVTKLGYDAPSGYYGLGVIYLKREDLTAAAAEFQNCVDSATERHFGEEFRDSVSNAFYYLGDIWERRDARDAAQGFYRKALEFNPNHRAALQKVGGMHNNSSVVSGHYDSGTHPSERNTERHGFADREVAMRGGSSSRVSAPYSPAEAGFYEYLKKDTSALGQQTLKLIDSLDTLGTITPRLSAYTGSMARCVFGFLVFLLLYYVRAPLSIGIARAIAGPSFQAFNSVRTLVVALLDLGVVLMLLLFIVKILI